MTQAMLKDQFGTYAENPQEVFEQAIKDGVLNINKDSEYFVGNYMYMGHDLNGKPRFKNIITRAYLGTN